MGRSLGRRHLLVEDRLEAGRRAGAAVLLRPGQAGVAALEEEAAPLAAERVAVALLAAAPAAPLLGQVRVEPRAQLGPEGGLVRRIAKIHYEITGGRGGTSARVGRPHDAPPHRGSRVTAP